MLIVSPNFATTTYKPWYTVPPSITSMPLSLNVIQASPIPFLLAAGVLVYFLFRKNPREASS